MKKRLLDSFALLVYFNKEKGFQKVRDMLAEAQESGDFNMMNEVNAGEVYYILFRKRGQIQADYFLETILPALPITIITNTFQDVIDAAKIKAEHPLAFADCFAAALARKHAVPIVTGDPEFKKIEHLVTVEWLNTP